MSKKMWRSLAIIIVMMLLFTACAPAAAPAEEAAPAVEEEAAPAEEEAAPAEEEAAPAEEEAAAEASEVNIVHYFSGDLGLEGMSAIFDSFKEAQSDYVVIDNTTGHEDFKTQILVMLAGDNPPRHFLLLGWCSHTVRG